MELKSLEGLDEMILSTVDPATGNMVSFDGDGNMYSFNPLSGAAELLLATMLPQSGIRRIVRRADGRMEGIGADGSIYRFSEQETQGLGLAGFGKWVKKTVDKIGDTKVGSILRTVATPVLAPAMIAQSLLKGESLKDSVKDSISRVREDTKVTGDLFGEVIRFVNRYINPATILLRNGWLIAMKINLFGVAATLRWAYAPDYAYVKARTGMSETEWNKTKTEAKRIGTIYWQFGGIEENLQKAILSGKGNRDNAVPRGDVKISTANDADEAQKFISEYDDAGNLTSAPGMVNANGTVSSAQAAVQAIREVPIPNFVASGFANRTGTGLLKQIPLRGLGEPASATAVATVSGAVAAVAAFLKPITELIQKGKNVVADVKNTVGQYLPKKQADIPEIAPIAPKGITPPGAMQNTAAQNTAANSGKAEPFYQSTPFLVGAGVLAAGGIALLVSRNGQSGSRQSGGGQSKPISGLKGFAKTVRRPKRKNSISGLSALSLS